VRAQADSTAARQVDFGRGGGANRAGGGGFLSSDPLAKIPSGDADADGDGDDADGDDDADDPPLLLFSPFSRASLPLPRRQGDAAHAELVAQAAGGAPVAAVYRLEGVRGDGALFSPQRRVGANPRKRLYIH